VKHPSHLPLLLALGLPAHGLIVKDYNATDHDRFTGFPAAPVMNPGFLYDATKFTGVGWWIYVSATYGTIYAPITAVSPRHLLCASHAQPPGGTTIRFVDATGALVTRTTSAAANVPNDSMGICDLCVITLSSPLPATVAHYPWLNLAGGEASYLGQDLMVLGQTPNGTPRGGHAAIAAFDTVDEPGLADTRATLWTYHSMSSPADDCALSPGDSGGPSFASVGGLPALVSTHLGAGTSGFQTDSYDTFLPHYVTRVDTILAPAGHRLIPVNFTATTLAIPAATASPATLRRYNPGQISFSVANAGAELTGNLAVTLSFPPGSQPSSLSAPGWVAEAGGSGSWNLRAATLAAGANLAFTASWSALPDLASVSASISAESDTASAISANPSFTLAPSYAEWADGLALPGQTADPDGDDLENLLEYALGGDPESGATSLPGGHPLLPVLSHQGGTVTLSYPERDDAVLRGISYLVETATSPSTLAGATTLPAGAASTTAPFSPAVPGFVKRTLTWPADGPKRFARVKVTLAE
jgi:hypothetical protein